MAKITNEARTELIALVVGMFDGAPGREVLADLIEAREAGMSLQDIADVLTTSDEYGQLYGNTTTEEFVEKMVDSLVGGLVSADDRQWAIDEFVTEMNAGATEAQVFVAAITALLSTGEDDEDWSAARIALENKIAVANYHSVTQNQPSTSLEELRAVLDGVDDTDASVEAAKAAVDGGSNPGETHNLTVGPDTITGGFGNDVFKALPVDGNGAPATTLSGFDAIDGGAGRDTLNIYTDGTENMNMPGTATVKNVEIVNIYNEAAAGNFGDASKFEGVEELWQHEAAVNVTNLGAGTTAGFKGVTLGHTVTAADGAASATVALSGAVATGGVAALDVIGAALNTVTVSGNLADEGDVLELEATLDDDAATATVATEVNTNLTLGGAGIRTVDLSGSTGGVNYVAGAPNIHTIKGGAGNDTLEIITATNRATGVNAHVDAGAGDNEVTLKATGTGAATVVTGDGDNTVTVSAGAAVKVSVTTGAGDDTIELTSAINSSTRIDGGEGNDTLSIAGGKALIAQDYILIDNAVTNIETLHFNTAAASVDASKMEQFETLSFTDSGTATEASGVALTTDGSLEASSTGYTSKAFGGDLNITQTGTGTIDASGQTVNLAVTAKQGAATISTVVGDAETLIASVNSFISATAIPQAATLNLTTGGGNNDNLTTLVLSGTGYAVVDNSAGALEDVDASALGAVIATKATGGLTYTANDDVAETITLGAGSDTVTTNSTFAEMDSIAGFDASEDGDVLVFNGITLDGTGPTVLEKIETTSEATSLELALTEVALEANGELVFFEFGGNTYLFQDNATATGATARELDDTDFVLEVTGIIDFSEAWAA